MSRPIQPSGMVVPSWRTSPPADRVADLPARPERRDVGRQPDGGTAVEERLARGDHVVLAQRGADVVAERLEEGEAHAAADEHLVGHAEQRVDHLELVAHLRAAEHGDERTGGVLPQPEQHLDLRREQATRGAGQVLGRADDRRVRRGATRRRRRSRRRRSPRPAGPRTRGRCPPRPDRTAGSRAARRPAPARRGGRGSERWSSARPACPSAGRSGWRRRRWRPARCSHSIVGRAARMRRSSVMAPSWTGTLKSARSSTRRPSSGGRSSRVGTPKAATDYLELGADDLDEVDEAVRVAPLVVVPAHDLHEVAVGHRDRRIERARRRRADDVGADDRLLVVDEHLRQRAALGGRLERRVDLVDGGFLGEDAGEVGDRAVGHRHPQRGAVELALHRLEHEARGSGGTGGARDDVDRGGAGLAQVLRRAVDDRLRCRCRRAPSS